MIRWLIERRRNALHAAGTLWARRKLSEGYAPFLIRATAASESAAFLAGVDEALASR